MSAGEKPSPFQRPPLIFRGNERIVPDPDHVADLEEERARANAERPARRREQLPLPKPHWVDSDREDRS